MECFNDFVFYSCFCTLNIYFNIAQFLSYIISYIGLKILIFSFKLYLKTNEAIKDLAVDLYNEGTSRNGEAARATLARRCHE